MENLLVDWLDGANVGTVFSTRENSQSQCLWFDKIQNVELNYKFLFYWFSIEA